MQHFSSYFVQTLEIRSKCQSGTIG